MATQLSKTLALAAVLLAFPARAQEQGHNANAAPYAGFQTRAIKSLSDQDISEIRNGEGWGLALPAELNGRPGPAHLLQLKDKLELTAEQVEKIEKIYETMHADAVAAGEKFIAAEAALSDAFAGSGLDDKRLRVLIDQAAAARADLRYVHLSQHLVTPDLLTEAQIRKYNVLRGYADDPCASVPEGHDPDMWRRHNHCS